jgi:hypothetical protein
VKRGLPAAGAKVQARFVFSSHRPDVEDILGAMIEKLMCGRFVNFEAE